MTGSRIADPVESTTETTIGTFYGKTNEWLEIPVQDVQMWTCDTPYLYDFTVEMEKDRVAGYFAMRKFTLEKRWTGIRADLPEPSGTVSEWSTGSGLLAGWTVYRTFR